MAIGDIGKAEIEVVADTSHFPESAKRGVEESIHNVDPSLKRAGQEWGDTASKGFGERIKSRVPEIIRDFTSEVRRQHIREDLNIDIVPHTNKDNVRSFVRNVAKDIENEVKGGGGGNGLGAIGQLFGDAIGSAFNVSGKSPLIYVLATAFGAIGALITAAIEAVYGLQGALLGLPVILAGIILQVGTLYLIWQNVSSVIGKALAATNAKELYDALKGINPYIANFALEVVYIRDAFKDITQYLSIAFFKNLGNVLLDIFDFNRYTLFKGLYTLAQDLGTWFNTIGQAFKTPQFASFLTHLFQITDVFIRQNGPVLERFLTQMFQFFDSLMGTAKDLGSVFDLFLKTIGNWFDKMSKSKDFQEFLAKVPGILIDTGRLVAVLADLFESLFEGVDKAGGQKFIGQLIFLVGVLSEFLKSDIGVEGLRAIMIILLILTAAFVDLIILVVGFLGAIQKAGEWISDVFWPKVTKAFNDFWHSIADGLNPIHWIDTLLGFLRPFEQLPNKLYNIGVNMIRSFIRGIKGQGPAALATAAARVVEVVAGAFPSSPAKYGPFSGKGAPYDRGVSTVEDFTKGLMVASKDSAQNAASSMSNVNFGTGAVIANFYGAQPTQDQARDLGTALGGGIGDQLLARNARLAVRTM